MIGASVPSQVLLEEF